MTQRPVIVLTSGRAGSSMLAEALHGAGVEMWTSPTRPANAEDRDFRRINEGALRILGLSIWRPRPLTLFEFDQVIPYIRSNAHQLPERVGQWGWKDPRTSLLWLPWSRVYPEARWVHLVRNGVDVALSMVRRAHHPPPEQDPGGFRWAFGIWESYVGIRLEAERFLGERCLRVRYEGLVAGGEWPRLWDWLGVKGRQMAGVVRPPAPRDAGPWAKDLPWASRSWAMAKLGY